jgi:hypothetical protein
MVVATVPSQRDHIQEARAGEVLGARLEILDIPPDDLGVNRHTIREFDWLLGKIRTSSTRTGIRTRTRTTTPCRAPARRGRQPLLGPDVRADDSRGVTPGGFKAQSFVDITDYIDRKCRSILSTAPRSTERLMRLTASRRAVPRLSDERASGRPSGGEGDRVRFRGPRLIPPNGLTLR